MKYAKSATVVAGAMGGAIAAGWTEQKQEEKAAVPAKQEGMSGMGGMSGEQKGMSGMEGMSGDQKGMGGMSGEQKGMSGMEGQK